MLGKIVTIIFAFIILSSIAGAYGMGIAIIIGFLWVIHEENVRHHEAMEEKTDGHWTDPDEDNIYQ